MNSFFSNGFGPFNFYLVDLSDIPPDNYHEVLEQVKYARGLNPDSNIILLPSESQTYPSNEGETTNFDLIREANKSNFLDVQKRPYSESEDEEYQSKMATFANYEVPENLEKIS